MIKDNEKIYDEQINPLVAKIYQICKEHKIPVIMSFNYAPDQEDNNSLVTTFVSEETLYGTSSGVSKAFAMALELIRTGMISYVTKKP